MEHWYEHMTLTDICQEIRNEINESCKCFVSIGYFLKQVRDRELYRETGHGDIWEFAQEKFGISKSSASRFMNINDRFSVGGNSLDLLEQYRNFTSSQLSEMLTLSDSQMEQVTEQTTIKEIRAMKPKKAKVQEVVILQQEVAAQEESACFHYKKFSSCDNCTGLHLMLKCTDKKMKQKFIRKNVKELDIPRDPEMRGYDMDEPYCPVCGEMLNGNSVQCSFCGQKIKQGKSYTLETEGEKKINPDVAMSQQNLETEEPEERDIIHEDDPEYFNYYDVRTCYQNAQSILHQMRNCDLKAEARKRQAIDVAAYSLLLDSLQDTDDEVRQMIYTNELPPKQPELPELTNNKKRGQFIDAYKTWPIWMESELTGERYFRYDFEDGIAVVVGVSLRHIWLRGKYSEETEYGAEEYYLIGLSIKYTVNGYQFRRNSNKTFHECKSNRSEIIEFLKKYQKGEIDGEK